MEEIYFFDFGVEDFVFIWEWDVLLINMFKVWIDFCYYLRDLCIGYKDYKGFIGVVCLWIFFVC